jgi:hypothetical protein
MVGERLEIDECILIDLAAILTNGAQQYFSRGAEGSVSPTGVLFAGFALPSLQDPLQRVIHHPPIIIQLRYEAI